MNIGVDFDPAFLFLCFRRPPIASLSPGEKTPICSLPRVRASCARASRVSNNCLHLFTLCAQLLDIESLAVKANCRVLRFTFLPDGYKVLSFSEIRWRHFYSFLCVLYSYGVLCWKQVLCGEGRVKAKVHVSFFRCPSRRAPRSSSTFRKGGEGKVKACLHLFLHRNDLILNSFLGGVKGEGKKRKLADVRVHACAREKMEWTIDWNMACLLRFFPCFEWYR